MSRIGRLPVVVPEGVKVEIANDNTVTVTGKLGTLSQNIGKLIVAKQENNEVVLTRINESNEAKAQHGLYRMLIHNMVVGVSQGFSKSVVINGVGYKATKQGNKVVMSIGFSHPVELLEENGIKLDCPSATEIVVSGISKEAVGQYAAKIRDIRPVEPYHAYGIKYKDEVVVRKEGKTSGKK